MPGQSEEVAKGGTLRLGSYPCRITAGTMMEKCYEKQMIQERHRHRYEFNNEYRETLIQHGLVISGTSPDDRLVEAVELGNHPFFVGVQFHPEFKSRPNPVSYTHLDVYKRQLQDSSDRSKYNDRYGEDGNCSGNQCLCFGTGKYSIYKKSSR